MSKSDRLAGKNIPLVEAAHYGRRQKVTSIVLRTSFTTGEAGAANAIAQTWHNSNSRIDSCHYVIDERQTIRCLPDTMASRSILTSAYRNAITINVCHDPLETPLPAVLHNTAVQVARLCKLHNIRLRVLTHEQKIAWMRRQWKNRGGILLETSGLFPKTDFLTLVQSEYSKL